MTSLPFVVLLAASAAAASPPGIGVAAVRCGPKNEFSYELYLPSGFERGRSWPILYVFDPRSRGRFALELFRSDAERLGFVVASSNDTRSDTDDARPSLMAVQAMWEHTHATLPLARGRAFAAGFSGGARLATSLGAAAQGALSGVFLAGAGFALPASIPKQTPFDVFAVAGQVDFNYYEMRMLDAQLERLEVPRTLELFDGSHAWPPRELIARGLDWLELQAMRRGRRPHDPALSGAFEREGLARAASLEARGQRYEASDVYGRLARTLEGLRESSPAVANARRLEALPDVAAERRRRERLDQRDKAFLDQGYARLEALFRGAPAAGSDGRTPPLPELLRELRVERLLREAESEDDAYERASAQRRIESLFVQSSFYLPRRLLDKREFGRAALSLGVAAALKPRDWATRYDLACAWSRAGQRKPALLELERAVEFGFENGEHMAKDDDLKDLRAEPRFQALLALLRVAQEPHDRHLEYRTALPPRSAAQEPPDRLSELLAAKSLRVRRDSSAPVAVGRPLNDG